MKTAIKLLYLLPLCLSLIATAVLAEEEDEEKTKPVEAQYFKLHNPFIVNIMAGGRSHYLQVEAQIMSKDAAQIEAVEHHQPAIRHHLLLLFSEQSYQEVKTVKGKKKLMDNTLAAINRTLKEETGKEGIEAVYFTSFVIQ